MHLSYEEYNTKRGKKATENQGGDEERKVAKGRVEARIEVQIFMLKISDAANDFIGLVIRDSIKRTK